LGYQGRGSRNGSEYKRAHNELRSRQDEALQENKLCEGLRPNLKQVTDQTRLAVNRHPTLPASAGESSDGNLR